MLVHPLRVVIIINLKELTNEARQTVEPVMLYQSPQGPGL